MRTIHPRTQRRIRLALTLGVLSAAAACGGASDDSQTPGTGGGTTTPTPGDSEFISAATNGGGGGRSADDASGGLGTGAGAQGPEAGAPTGGDGNTGARTVEEGDIYRVYTDRYLLNLSQYRGLQVIDLADVARPAVVGRAAVWGSPSEMYTVGTTALVLVNGYQTYTGAGLDATSYQGGLLLAVNLSTPQSPVILGTARVPGNITTSRLTRSDAASALYVVSTRYDWESGTGGGTTRGDVPVGGTTTGGVSSESAGRTFVTSFDVTNPAALRQVTELELSGNGNQIHATTGALVVPRVNYNYDRADGGCVSTTLTYVDISNPAGQMVKGGEVTVSGEVRTKFNMDVFNGILRVVSHEQCWDGRATRNAVTTFDAHDFRSLRQVERQTFGGTDDLFATVFVGNKAFFVTYLRRDPFHAFEITDAGEIHEHAEFIVSGWNDFFKVAADSTRLVGVGMNDESGRQVAISLYDITNLTNATPLVDREMVDAEWSYSQANWDDKAFSVIEGAVAVEGANGLETGLVLLPYSGYSEREASYFSGVQIFTFNQAGVTKRGKLDHGSPVSRTFVAAEHVANLSELELSLFDFKTNIDQPREVGRVELAPNNADFFALGNGFGVKRVERDAWGYWRGGTTAGHESVLRVVSMSGDPDTAAPVAEVTVPTGSTIVQDGTRLVVVSTTWAADGSSSTTTARVVDFANPAAPAEAGSATTSKDLWGNGGYYGGYDVGVAEGAPPPTASGGAAEPARQGLQGADIAPGYGYYRAYNVVTLDGRLAFLVAKGQQELLGTTTWCYEYPVVQGCEGSAMGGGSASGGGSTGSAGMSAGSSGAGTPNAAPAPGASADGSDPARDGGAAPDKREGDESCTSWVSGGISCHTRPGASEVCDGQIQRCDMSTGCTTLDPADIQTTRDCHPQPEYRYWTTYSIEVLDFTTPATPRFLDTVAIDGERDVVGFIGQGTTIYFTSREDLTLPGDTRAYQRYYFQAIELSGAAPAVGAPVNIPGVLSAVSGEQLFTQDYSWSENGEVTVSLNRLGLRDGRAYLDARREFTDRSVANITFGGDGRAYVTHNPSYGWLTRTYGDAYYQTPGVQTGALSIIDLNGPGLPELAKLDLPAWAHLQTVASQRAFFSVSGGVLVVDLSTPTSPRLSAFYPLQGWPNRIVVSGGRAYVPAGWYGLYALPVE